MQVRAQYIQALLRMLSGEEVREAVDKAIAFYNAEWPHSSLDWRTPDQAHRMSGEMKKHWHSWREDAIRREQAMAI